MKRAQEGTQGLERSLALVQRNLFQQASPLASVGRFELVRTLGSGGMGVVYEAFDREHGERVALKMLNACGPTDLYRLKREFRSLAAISHPNLVALHELHVCEQHAFFTMELVAGSDLFSYFEDCWSSDALGDLGPLREVLAQLCRGLIALHEEGKVHGDLKPSNVLVTELGQVVLVDFGMVREAVEHSAEIEGTPLYMAPERFLGRIGEASDWYSFGRIVHQLLALAGRNARADVDGSSLHMLAARLLDPDHRRRPRGREVLLTILGKQGALSIAPGQSLPVFVGRHAELAAMQRAFVRSRTRPVLVLLRGEPGIGKSALMTHFAGALRMNERALVASGRCYEHEYVAFKALDGAVDDLSRQLAHGSERWVEQLSAEERGALVQLFAVLGRLPAWKAAPGRDAIHPVAARNRGFSALKRLLAVIAAERRVVLCIDDLHWADEDSAALLGGLLHDDDSPPLLVIATDRTPPGAVNPVSEELARLSANAARPPEQVELTLTNLSHAETRALAFALVPGRARGAVLDVERLAAGSLGSPLLLTELLRSRSRASEDGARTLSQQPIDAIVGERLAELSEPARGLLALIAIAGRPVSSIIADETLSLGHARRGLVRDLCRAGLIQVSRRGQELLFTVAHDRIGEAVLRRLAPQARRELHARLAAVLDAQGALAGEGALAQYLAAGLRERAAERARQAGELALSALAFARAAWLFERALELGSWSDPARMHLYVELATAQAHAGKGVLAAAAYLEAAQLCGDQFARGRWQALAAEQLMSHGRSAEGLALLEECYERLGVRWPTGRVELVIRTLGLLVSAELRGLRRAAEGRGGKQHLARAQLFTLAGTCLEGFDDQRSLYNALWMLREGEFSPEPVLRARALGLRGFMRAAAVLRGGTRRGLRDLQAACKLASAHGELSASTDIQGQLAAAHFLHGDTRAALRCALGCADNLRIYPLPPRDLYRVLGVIGFSLWTLGELRDAERCWREFSDMARNQTDAATSFWIHASPARFALSLAADDQAGARAMLQRQAQVRAQHPAYRFARWVHSICSAEAALYFESGERALPEVETQRLVLSQTGYAFLSAFGDVVLARGALMAASEVAGEQRVRLLRRAALALWRLRLFQRSEPLRAATAMLRAGLETLRGGHDQARRHLQRALTSYEAQGAKLSAASARYQLGSMLQGSAGSGLQASALSELRAQGVVDCQRWLRWSLPGFQPTVTLHA